MTITVYARRNFKGVDVTGFDLDNFRQIAHPIIPTSVRLTTADDKILFFTHVKWGGRAMFRSGVQEISNLGHPGDGGAIGFENTITGMRVTPFTLRLRFHAVTDANGAFPDNMTSIEQVRESINNTINEANDAWRPYLVRFELESITVPAGVAKFFNMNNEYYKLVVHSRKFDRLKGGANVVLVNQVAVDLDGTAVPHSISRMVLLEGTSFGKGLVLAHELGHFLGLLHKADAPDNLMTGDGVRNSVLTNDQVADAHQSFANYSLIEKGVRVA